MSTFDLNAEFIDENKSLALQKLRNVSKELTDIVTVLRISTGRNENFLSTDLDEDMLEVLNYSLNNVNFCISELEE